MLASMFTRHVVGKSYFGSLRMASTVSSIKPKLYVLQYDYVQNAIEKRKPYREAHLSLVDKQKQNGNIILGGAVGNPPTGGLLIFRNLSETDIEQFVKQDPYVINGVVKNYTIKPYMAVAGDNLLNNDLIKI